jgi:hypothetical protein
MTKIEKVLLPSDEKGNDPNAHRKDPDIWKKVQREPPESGPHYIREGFEDRAAAQVSDARESKAEAALSRILNASLRNPDQLAKVKARLADTKWFMPGLAAYGEITHFYGPSGSGKTLLWVSLLLKKLTPEQRRQVIYLNFDDSPHGAVQKMELLNDVEMITEGEADQWIDALLATEHLLKGKVIILDTIKKFAAVIQKDSVRKLFILLRKMVNEGATVISLGHTNKHLNEAGELVFEGVNDIKSDPDGLVLIQRFQNPISGESTIIVTPDEHKARAGQSEQAFRFSARDQETEYEELVYSCEELTIEQIEREKKNLREQNLREAFADEIDMVEYFLRENPASVQSKIVDYWKANSDNYGFGRPRLMNALKALTGICWTIRKGSNNSKIYSLSI